MPLCKICETETTTIYDEQFDQNYYSCPNCEFISLEEEKVLSKEEEHDEYLNHENSLENEGYVKMLEAFIEMAVTPFVKPPAKVLEFGSGPGPVLAHLLKEHKYDVDIYDPFFAPDRAYADKEYDLITSTEVVEHFQEPLESFARMTNSLKPGGILALMTQFHPNAEEEDFLDWYYKRERSHISFYTKRTLKILGELFLLEPIYCNERNVCVLRKINALSGLPA
jgi:SAM-dependent methyltransferase